MPVQIIDDSKEGYIENNNELEVTMTEYTNGIIQFNNHYSYNALTQLQNTNIKISWNKFEAAITDFINTTSVQENEVAIQLMHCLETDSNNYYIKMRLCKLNNIIHNNQRLLNYTQQKWYKLQNHNTNDIVPIATPTYTEVDSNYSNNVRYLDDAGNSIPISNDGNGTYVRNLVLPWEIEIKKMYQNNDTTNTTKIGFTAFTSHINIQNNTYCNVEWPHGMAAYLIDEIDGIETPKINDTDSVVLFENRGADYATLCPPNCHKHIMHTASTNNQ